MAEDIHFSWRWDWGRAPCSGPQCACQGEFIIQSGRHGTRCGVDMKQVRGLGGPSYVAKQTDVDVAWPSKACEVRRWQYSRLWEPLFNGRESACWELSNEKKATKTLLTAIPPATACQKDELEDELEPWLHDMERETHKADDLVAANGNTSWILGQGRIYRKLHEGRWTKFISNWKLAISTKQKVYRKQGRRHQLTLTTHQCPQRQHRSHERHDLTHHDTRRLEIALRGKRLYEQDSNNEYDARPPSSRQRQPNQQQSDKQHTRVQPTITTKAAPTTTHYSSSPTATSPRTAQKLPSDVVSELACATLVLKSELCVQRADWTSDHCRFHVLAERCQVEDFKCAACSGADEASTQEDILSGLDAEEHRTLGSLSRVLGRRRRFHGRGWQYEEFCQLSCTVSHEWCRLDDSWMG